MGMNDQGLIRSNQNSFSAAYRMADVLIILLVLLAAVRLNGLELSPSYMVAGLIAVCVFLLVSESLELKEQKERKIRKITRCKLKKRLRKEEGNIMQDPYCKNG